MQEQAGVGRSSEKQRGVARSSQEKPGAATSIQEQRGPTKTMPQVGSILTQVDSIHNMNLCHCLNKTCEQHSAHVCFAWHPHRSTCRRRVSIESETANLFRVMNKIAQRPAQCLRHSFPSRVEHLSHSDMTKLSRNSA